jgi:hypothetical protein
MNANTILFAQEIYDASGQLIAVYEKFPVDLAAVVKSASK